MSELVDPEAQREEEDGDQLTAEDTLEQIVVDDILDEGYSPDERDTRVHWGETAPCCASCATASPRAPL